MLEFKEVSLELGNKQILKQVSFILKKQDFTALAGPNGAGKTTLLRCIIRFVKAQQGEINLCGKNINHLQQDEIGRLIGYVPQALQTNSETFTYQLFSSLNDTVNKELFSALKIPDLLNRRFRTLSAGEKQKALLASALENKPQILLLDEPTQNTDSDHSDLTGKLLSDLNTKNGLTILAVSHDMAWIRQFTRQTLLLKDGQLEERS